MQITLHFPSAHGKRAGSRAAPARLLLGLGLAALITACGGGGGGAASTTAATATATFAPSATLANICANPRPGTADRQGSLAQEKAYLRSFVHESYLWYQDVPEPMLASNATAQAYFEALKTPKTTPSGAPVDQFHFWETTEVSDAASAGLETGYGIRWLRLSDTILPRHWVVAQVEPGSPAALAGVKRGERLSAIDACGLSV
jgi:carboxyl-terminal processing protease